jgi:hypothetical protein
MAGVSFEGSAQAVLVGERTPRICLVADAKQQANGAQLGSPVMQSRTPGSSGCAGTFLSTAQIPLSIPQCEDDKSPSWWLGCS